MLAAQHSWVQNSTYWQLCWWNKIYTSQI